VAMSHVEINRVYWDMLAAGPHRTSWESDQAPIGGLTSATRPNRLLAAFRRRVRTYSKQRFP